MCWIGWVISWIIVAAINAIVFYYLVRTIARCEARRAQLPLLELLKEMAEEIARLKRDS